MLNFSISLRPLFVFTLISLCIQNVLGDGTITITEAAAYSSLLPCGQQCIYSQDLGCPNVPDPIGNAIGCYDNLNAGCNKVSWALDSCYCRSDLQAYAVKALSKCVLSRCTIGDSVGDFTSASSVYAGYCSAAGFVINTAVVASTTTAGGGGLATTKSGAVIPIATGTTAPSASAPLSGTSVPSSSSSSSGTSGLSTGTMLGIIIPSCSIAIGAIGIVVKVWRTRVQRQMHDETRFR